MLINNQYKLVGVLKPSYEKDEKIHKIRLH